MVDIFFMESVTKESIVSIKNEVDYFICSRNIEAITVPIDCHVIRTHSVKHEILKVLKRLRRSEKCVCHVDIIGTGSDASGVLLCHLGRWLARLTGLYQLAVVHFLHFRK